MQVTYTDYAGDTLTVTSHDKCALVGFKVDLEEVRADGSSLYLVDLNRDQVRDLIAQLHEWQRMQSIDPVKDAQS